jgi:hypothetical protein
VCWNGLTSSPEYSQVAIPVLWGVYLVSTAVGDTVRTGVDIADSGHIDTGLLGPHRALMAHSVAVVEEVVEDLLQV